MSNSSIQWAISTAWVEGVCPVLTVVVNILLATAFQVETLPALVAIVSAV